jgi:hypothetical protein
MAASVSKMPAGIKRQSSGLEPSPEAIGNVRAGGLGSIVCAQHSSVSDVVESRVVWILFLDSVTFTGNGGLRKLHPFEDRGLLLDEPVKVRSAGRLLTPRDTSVALDFVHGSLLA